MRDRGHRHAQRDELKRHEMKRRAAGGGEVSLIVNLFEELAGVVVQLKCEGFVEFLEGAHYTEIPSVTGACQNSSWKCTCPPPALSPRSFLHLPQHPMVVLHAHHSIPLDIHHLVGQRIVQRRRIPVHSGRACPVEVNELHSCPRLLVSWSRRRLQRRLVQDAHDIPQPQVAEVEACRA